MIFKILSKCLFRGKIPKYSKHRKTRNSLFYAGSRAYLPEHCLYFLPLPHGKILKQTCNFFLFNWCFLFQIYNFLLKYCKFLFNNLSNNLSKKIYFLLQFFDIGIHSRMISFFIIKINSIFIISKNINQNIFTIIKLKIFFHLIH